MLMYIPKMLAAFLAIAMLSACAVTSEKIVEDGGSQLTGEEIQALYSSGLNVAWTAASRTTGTAYYAPDGGANVKFGSNNWVGKWRVDDQLLCAAYPERDNGADRCFTVFRKGSGGYSWFNTNGSHGGDFTVVQ